MIQWNRIILYRKDNCLACELVRRRLVELNVPFEVRDFEGAVPILKIGEQTFFPPISTKTLKFNLDKYGKTMIE